MSEKQVRIRNINAEILLIKSFTACGKEGRKTIIENITDEHFGSNVGKIVWKRALSLHSYKNLPFKGGWEVLVNDSVLHNKESVQDILSQYDTKEVSNKFTFVLELIKTLNFFKHKREAFFSLQEAHNQLADAEDRNDVTEALLPIISTARTALDIKAKEQFFRLDTLDLMGTLKSDMMQDSVIARTLWHQYDTINSGLSFTDLVTIAATTSGGKSVIAFLNLMTNFALQGLKVAGASLEMSKKQITQRQTAYVSGIPMHKIRSYTLTKDEEEQINRSGQLFLELVAKRGGSFWVWEQLDKDSTVTEILNLLYEKGPNVILIDYINLLKRPKGVEEREALGEIAREAKLFAKSHNCIVIILAQLNEEEHVKYSKAVEEHCVVGDSLIDTENGLIRIDSVIPKNDVKRIIAEVDIKVSTAHGIRKAYRWYKKGIKDCIAINTKTKNFSVTGSATTKVLVLQNDLSIVWKKLNEIKENDFIAIKRQGYCWNDDVIFNKVFESKKLRSSTKNYKTPDRMTPELARVCGYLIAEGHLSGWYSIGFCNGNEKIANDYTNLFNKLFNADKEYKWRNQAKAFYTKTESRIIKDFFDYIGCKGSSRTKEVPWSILQSSKESAIEFLRGYFAGDMSKDLEAVTYSKNLVKQLQMLLLKLGIVAKIQENTDNYDRIDKTKSNKYYKLSIRGKDRIVFQEEIGLLFRKCKRRIKHNSWQSISDRIPYIIEYLDKYKKGPNTYITENNKIIQLKLKAYLGKYLASYDKINNKDFLLTLKEHFPLLFIKIQTIKLTNYYWDQVNTIRKEKRIVYDFSVEKNNAHKVLGEGSFIANGIVVHNSDSVIIWKYPPLNRPGYINVKCSKARNQIPYSFYLVEDFANMRVYDLLEPMGLALMLGRSNGKVYRQKSHEYFGIRRLIEMQDTLDKNGIGIPKHKFKESINWSELTDQYIPSPNVPDITAVVDMVQEMLSLIASYNPHSAKILIDNLKKSEILKPYSDIVQSLDLPTFAKVALGIGEKQLKTSEEKQKRLLTKLEQDLLTATQDLYIKGDKIIKADRKADLPPNKENIYDTAYKIEQKKEQKSKEVFDPTNSESKWVKANKFYMNKQKLKVDNTIVSVTPENNPLNSIGNTDKLDLKNLIKHAKSKEALNAFIKQRKLVLNDSPSSTDTINEHMMIEGGIDEPIFLLGNNENYLDELEKNIEFVGYHLQRKIDRITDHVYYASAQHLLGNGKLTWAKGVINEEKLKYNVTVAIGETAKNYMDIDATDDIEFPTVTDLIEQKNINLLYKTINSVYNRENIPVPMVDLSIAKQEKYTKNLPLYFKSMRNFDNVPPNISLSEIKNSPYLVLYSKPQYLGYITKSNYKDYVSPEYFFNVINGSVIKMLLTSKSHEDFDWLCRSICWSVINPDYRDDNVLLEYIRQNLLTFLINIGKSGDINQIYDNNAI